MKLSAKIISIILAVILPLSLCAPLCTEADEAKVVRIGYIDYNGFIAENNDGTYIGYGVDYLDEISKYTGYRYEYVFGKWTDLLVKLNNKEIDFLCSAQRTDERIEKYDFSAYPIGYTQGLLYALPDSDICYEDYSAFDGLTVGMIKDNAMNAIFAEYAKKTGFNYTGKLYDTESALLAMLNSGEVDAICSEHLANHQNLSLIANYGADAYYMMSYKCSPYMDDVNYALKQIKTDPDFETNLYHKYYDSSAAESMVQFTAEEKAYIESAGELAVGLMPNRSPISYSNDEGEPSGMMVDLLEIIAKKTGLKFKYEFLGDMQTGYDYMQKGGDLVAGVADSDFSNPNPALLKSDPLQVGSVVFVGRKGMNFSADSALTVAVPKGFFKGKEMISAAYPNFNFYDGDNNASCLEAIRDGKADILLQNMYIIRECLQSPLYDELAIFPAYSFKEKELAVALPENALLISIINKAVATISAEEANNVVINNTIAKVHNASLGEVFYKYRFPLIGIVVLFFIIIAMFVAIEIIRRRSYTAAEKANARLERTNKQLADSVRQAESANAAKSQFLSRMSHEIRTPMNAIVGLTAIAKTHEDETNKVDDYLTKIETSSKVLLNLINDVLDMSAIENNKLKIANEEFDIKKILTSIATIYYPQCENKNVNFVMATDLESEIFRGDSLRVSQILLNLVSNAYKFTESGGTIRVNVKESVQHGNKVFVRFTVSDNGEGMTPEMLDRLFKPFEQENADTFRAHGGSGLGLSITKNLIDIMHGAIKAESEKGKGTTFTVDLPFETVGEASSKKNDLLKDKRVLVVDDDPTSLDYASIVLARIGVQYRTASSGERAIAMINEAAAEQQPYDVALIDWNMPGMDGGELTRRIRASASSQTLIIIASAYDLNEIEDKAKEAGADHCVSKPLFQSTVFDELMSLSLGELHRESTEPPKYDFSGHKVLLAEDNELNAEIAKELLSMVNMACDRAPNGEAAVKMYEGSAPGTYDAVLMDVQMPIMNGYEATRAIRALDRADAKTVSIFAMTANAFTEDVSKALSSGMNGHIAKPINTEALYKALDEAVKKREKE